MTQNSVNSSGKSDNKFDSPALQTAWMLAMSSRDRAHAPYSKFRVGAALKLKGVDVLVPGCNVENASFGATICAERTAFQVARALHGEFEPEYLVLVTDTEPPVAPCALCLQVMAEFCRGDFPVYVANTKGIQKQVKFDDLLPIRFEKSQLK